MPPIAVNSTYSTKHMLVLFGIILGNIPNIISIFLPWCSDFFVSLVLSFLSWWWRAMVIELLSYNKSIIWSPRDISSKGWGMFYMIVTIVSFLILVILFGISISRQFPSESKIPLRLESNVNFTSLLCSDDKK